MSLRDILRLEEFSGLNNQAALDLGNSSIVIATDSTAYTWSGIGAKIAELQLLDLLTIVDMRDTLSTCRGYAMLDAAFLSGGFDCTLPLNRGLIQTLEISDPPEAVQILDAFLEIGVRHGTYWQKYGIAEPTLDDITVAKRQNMAADWWARVQYELVPYMLDGSSVDEIKAAIAVQG